MLTMNIINYTYGATISGTEGASTTMQASNGPYKQPSMLTAAHTPWAAVFLRPW